MLILSFAPLARGGLLRVVHPDLSNHGKHGPVRSVILPPLQPIIVVIFSFSVSVLCSTSFSVGLGLIFVFLSH